MKKLMGLFLFSFALCLSVPGCGAPEPSSVMDNAEQSEIEKYEALIESQAAEMDSAPPSEQLEAPKPLPVNTPKK